MISNFPHYTFVNLSSVKRTQEAEGVFFLLTLSHWDDTLSLLSYTQHQTPDPNHSLFFFFYLTVHTILPRHPSCSSTAPQIRELASSQLYLPLFPTKQNWLQRGVGRRVAGVYLNQEQTLKSYTELVFFLLLSDKGH